MSATDLPDLPGAIREAVRELAAGAGPDGGVLGRAILAVLDLEPPPFYSGDDLELYGLLTSGWRTCHDAVLLVLARELGVNP